MSEAAQVACQIDVERCRDPERVSFHWEDAGRFKKEDEKDIIVEVCSYCVVITTELFFFFRIMLSLTERQVEGRALSLKSHRSRM